MKIDYFVVKRIFLRPGGGFLFQLLFWKPTQGFMTPTASASHRIPQYRSAPVTDLRVIVFLILILPLSPALSLPTFPLPPLPPSPPFSCTSASQMLQHSQISPTDYSSYPPSRDSRQGSVKLESSDTPGLGASISNHQPPYHFGSDSTFNYTFMSAQQWKPPMRSQSDGTHPFESTNNPNRVKFDLALLDSGSHGTQDDSYDDADVDPFSDSQPTASTSRSAGSSDKSGEKHIRRRSSKGESNFHPPRLLLYFY